MNIETTSQYKEIESKMRRSNTAEFVLAVNTLSVLGQTDARFQLDPFELELEARRIAKVRLAERVYGKQ